MVYWAISYFPICFPSREFRLCSAFRAAKPNPAASPHTRTSPCPTDAGTTWSPAADGLPLTDRQEPRSPRPFGSWGGLVALASPQGSGRARWGQLGAAVGPALPLPPAGRGRPGLVPCLEMPQHAGHVPWAAANVSKRQILTLLFTCLLCIISYSALGCRPGQFLIYFPALCVPPCFSSFLSCPSGCPAPGTSSHPRHCPCPLPTDPAPCPPDTSPTHPSLFSSFFPAPANDVRCCSLKVSTEDGWLCFLVFHLYVHPP